MGLTLLESIDASFLGSVWVFVTVEVDATVKIALADKFFVCSYAALFDLSNDFLQVVGKHCGVFEREAVHEVLPGLSEAPRIVTGSAPPLNTLQVRRIILQRLVRVKISVFVLF